MTENVAQNTNDWTFLSLIAIRFWLCQQNHVPRILIVFRKVIYALGYTCYRLPEVEPLWSFFL